MKLQTLLAGAAIACIITVYSCRKNYSPTNTSTPSVTQLHNNMRELYSALQTEPQTFTVTAGVTSTIVCSQGTKLTFYPNSFKDKNGNTLTSGTVTVKITEMYSPGSMITGMAGTTTKDGHVLKSSGQMNISATHNGEELTANRYNVSFVKSDSAACTMNLYYGDRNNADSALQWTIDDDGYEPGTYYNGASSELFFIFDSCTGFGYVNCDVLHSDSAYTQINVIVPDTSYGPENTEIFLILPSINSFMQNRIGKYSTARHSFLLGDDGQTVPVGMLYKIVVVAKKGTQYYYGIQSGTTMSEKNDVNVPLSAQPLSYVVSQIKAL